MDWNCTFTEERLSDYLEGQLGATDSAALLAHTKTCTNCGQLVARVSGLVNEMHRMELLEEPAELHAKIMDATLGPRPSKEGWRRWFAWVPMLWQPRFAMGIATVAACCLVVVQAGGVTPGKLRRADLNPVDMLRAVNRQAHLTYARGVKFVNNFRVVYEIQSRLEPEPPQEQPPARRQQHDSKPHSTYPQQKSETHPGRREARADTLFAQVLEWQTLTPVAFLALGVPTRSLR
jgi:Putative zinc-finger